MKTPRTSLSQALYLTLIYLFFYIPIGILIVYSFNNSSYSLVWHGLTSKWYHNLFQDTGLWIAALHSLIIGVLAATFASIIGTLAAVSLYRYRFMGKSLINGMVFILIVTPDIVMGISLLLLFSIFHMSLGFWSLLLSHITFCIPFVVVTIYSRITGLDKNIFEAAKDLGSREVNIFFKITIPLLLPAIISGILLCFTLSFDDVMISYFVSGPGFEILPLKIYSMARLGVKPELNALCTVTFSITLLLVILSQRLTRKK
jgi:spermidine/putrescine transport system permease protein